MRSSSFWPLPHPWAASPGSPCMTPRWATGGRRRWLPRPSSSTCASWTCAATTSGRRPGSPFGRASWRGWSSDTHGASSRRPMTLEALLQAVCDNPTDDAPRLVYADWLEENGDSERAEFIRLQIELARLPLGDPRRDE